MGLGVLQGGVLGGGDCKPKFSEIKSKNMSEMYKNENLPESARKWFLVGMVTFTTVFLANLILAYKLFSSLSIEGKWLRLVIIINIIVFSFVAVVINYWSIIRVNSYSKWKQTKLAESDKCLYCSSTNRGSVLCKECSSIQWFDISSIWVQIATFIAVHRWQLMTSFLALFIAFPTVFIYEKIKEEQVRVLQLNTKLKECIDNLNNMRSMIVSIESDVRMKIDPQSIKAKYSEFDQIYRNLSWTLRDYFVKAKPMTDDLSIADTVNYFYNSNLLNEIDSYYLKYQDALLSHLEKEGATLSSESNNIRRRNALSLYYASRVINYVLFNLSNHSEIKSQIEIYNI